ncbi:hypothetical protein ABB37_01382 [Leptomonas pyrrhocoris]|uniref:Uncharacterized protein n=1 Tax=Leptomonas pyrrhocoris TaxID=157538 RepID=A0A0M9G8N3_LEPPY|nr:hypothetical protein ABB37_01382 [Leptomonas pyrrhocoris]KPA84937.1 hypothetical protein ABB37_01382 [Leptomonas pyrrhocoris]|eukprot:XP_015663376.1 hypothetical protein ABB37_01382 [Leptomonas pyrrhocoris]
MRRRTRSRSRAHSQTSASAEEDDIFLGLQRLLDKLLQFQPVFTEEDVAVIPFLPDRGSSCTSSPSLSAPTSPRLSPSRHDNEESTAQQDCKQSSAPPSPPTVDSRGTKLPSQTMKAATASHVGGAAIDLDGPISSALFVTAVNLFDAKMLAKSRRVATEALKLVRQAYVLIWKDNDYLARFMNGEPNRGANGSSSHHRNHKTTSIEAPAARRSSHGTRHMPFSAAAPCPERQPNRQLALLLDECIRALLVYANVSVNLCHGMATNSRVLLLLSFVCCTARRLEEEDEVPYGEGRGCASDVIVGNRNLHTELDSLGQVWHDCGIEGRVADSLHECYLIEFLLDAALPPAVCSSRYDGLLTAAFEKKRRIISDVVASRSGFAHMMRVAPLRGLCGLANMSAFGDAKLRARLLDKMASEGVVERLASEIGSAMEAILRIDDLTASSYSASKRRRPALSRGSSPPHQRSRASTSEPPSRRDSRPTSPLPHCISAERERSADEASTPRVSTGLDRVLNTKPTPVERIGQCVDILMLLSSPNLCPSDGNEVSSSSSSSRTSASSPRGAVRATTWASHEDALHEISLYLLSICFLPSTHARYAELTSLQLYAADCVLQWAAYSGKFYTLVVHALDELLDAIEAKNSRRGSGTTSPQRSPPLKSRSPSRSPSRTPKKSGNVATVPGHRLLRQLLPGDETGLLPLLTNLLQYTIHAEANATSIQRWFQFLADRVLPGVFEAPALTTGRRSTSEWGRRHLQQQFQLQSQKGSRASSLLRASAVSAPNSLMEVDRRALDPPVLARDLTRAEVAAIAPYFRFVRQVVEETSWRAGTAALLGKVVLLAFNVIVTQGHRCNLIFGQACACYDVAAPLLLTMQGESSPRRSVRSSAGQRSTTGSSNSSYRCSTVLMHQLRSEEEEDEEARRELERNEEEVFIKSAAKKKRSPSKSARRQGSPRKGHSLSWLSPVAAVNEERDDFSPFIDSPSGSPIFYGPYSPSSETADWSGDNSEEDSSPFDNVQRGSDLRAALEEAATPPPLPQPSSESPQPVTQSWTGRLSLRSLFSSLTGRDEAPLQK